MLNPMRLNPKAQKKLAKIEARRIAAKNRAMVNDFQTRWLALKNDAIEQCANGKNYAYCVYAVGMYALIGLKAMEREALAIAEVEHIGTLKTMRAAIQETAEIEALTYELRCALMDGIEIIEAVTEKVSAGALCFAWQYVDSGLRNGVLTTATIDQLIESLGECA